MADSKSARTGRPAGPVVLARMFAAPRARVFEAWTRAEHVKRWFSPETYTVPQAEVDCRPGGVFAVCMRSPAGEEHWSRGRFVEVVAPERLVLEGSVFMDGEEKFKARTTVEFEAVGEATRMTVSQAYTIFDERFAAAVEGAPEGWRTTLDKLGNEVRRIGVVARGGAVHDRFTVERRLRAAPARVFAAFTDPAAKERWFAGGEGYETLARRIDVRPGGREHVQGRWASGLVSTFDAIYLDVVADRRLVYTYEMHLDQRKISVSLATVELFADGSGTHLVVTEQGTFLDGYDDAGARERGTAALLDRLASVVDAQ